jgi:alpha-N-acetylglucosaminidase
MMRSFYLPRWEMYFDYLSANLQKKETEAIDFFTWERQWVENQMMNAVQDDHRPLQEIVSSILR